MRQKKHSDLIPGGFILLLSLLVFHCLFNGLDFFPRIDLKAGGKIPLDRINRLSSFNKITLGIPVSINLESEEALTAIPGMGPKTARLIVLARNKTGGFKQLKDLKHIRGIGPARFAKIKPFLTL